MALHKKEEALCLELNTKDGLQGCYGNQAAIMRARGQLREALTLLEKQEALSWSWATRITYRDATATRH
jgi:hypothetical protein